MKKQILNNATFTGREMQAIAAMLLSSEGINVDPIINSKHTTITAKEGAINLNFLFIKILLYKSLF